MVRCSCQLGLERLVHSVRPHSPAVTDPQEAIDLDGPQPREPVVGPNVVALHMQGWALTEQTVEGVGGGWHTSGALLVLALVEKKPRQ